MSHALLLRLFLSPSFFSVHVALRYLKTYHDHIGITYYLTRRLREIPIHELSDVWGFICHLLVSRPSKSRALECFVVEGAHKSTHIAMITLWFMQASLRDLASSSHESQSFMICQRTLLRCHEIIFGDSLPTRLPYSTTVTFPFKRYLTRIKVAPRIEPALVGLGVVLAGAPGMPQLTRVVGEVAIEQGRIDDEGKGIMSLHLETDQTVPDISNLPTNEEPDDHVDETEEQLTEDFLSTFPPIAGNDIAEVTRIDARTIKPGSEVQATPLHPLQENLRLSLNPLDQPGFRPSSRPTTPSRSSPSISTPKVFTYANLRSDEELIQNYDLQSQSHLLRGHYCRSEVQFLLSLENICNRLLVVPKPARISALRAELTGLNHRLPAEVCMLMWCTSTDGPQDPHHRIVRIPPGESVVLNSAERSPYLLIVEVLQGDLDFDPQKRANKEVLKKIVTKEEAKKTAPGLSLDSTLLTLRTPEATLHTNAALDEDNDAAVELPLVVLPPTPDQIQDEEMDLVEQLYGPDQLLRSRPIDFSESIVLPPPLKNKELDMAAWSRQGSPRMPPAPEKFSSCALPLSAAIKTPGRQQEPNWPIHGARRVISLDEYSERMRTAAIMLTQLNANLVREPITPLALPGTPSITPEQPRAGWLHGSSWSSNPGDQVKQKSPLPPSLNANVPDNAANSTSTTTRMKLQPSEAAAIRDRIMKEMLALEEERMERMRSHHDSKEDFIGSGGVLKTPDDEQIIRRELDKADPSAVVFSESWETKKSRIRHSSPYGHLANWDCVSMIVKTGADLRQEQLAVSLIREFDQIWHEEKVACWVKFFRILITGGTSGIVETITDAVSIHSIKKALYARRLTEGRLGHVTLLDHFKATYGDPSSAKFARAQRHFAKSLAGYSVVTYLLQIKDRHNGNILLDRDGHLIHIDFGFMLSNTPGNIHFEAAPFKLSTEYVEVLGGVDAQPFLEFRRLFREGFEAARKHCDRVITLVELMQKDSTLPCFAALGEQTAIQLRDRFQPTMTHALVGDHVEKLIDNSLGSNWTRLYDSYQYYSQSIL